MPIGDCDCCHRLDVPVSHGSDIHGNDVTACFICQGDSDADPYGEIELVCEACGGDRVFDDELGRQRCASCEGIGFYIPKMEPVALEDLEDEACKDCGARPGDDRCCFYCKAD